MSGINNVEKPFGEYGVFSLFPAVKHRSEEVSRKKREENVEIKNRVQGEYRPVI